jgi:hypothetical protein
MAYTAPNFVPLTLRAGDTAAWSRSLADYPASAGWIITTTLVKAGAKITVVSTADDDAHQSTVAAAVTADWVAGNYVYQERVSKAAESYTVGTGQIEILPDFASTSPGGLDARLHAQRTLEALEAWIENRDLGVAEYEIAGRRLKTIPITDLLLLRDRYKREARAQSGPNGAGKSGRIYLRF